MTRPLLITAACGYIVAIVCFAAAFSLGGGQWAPWTWRDGQGFDAWDWDFDGRGPAVSGGGPETTRVLAWPGGSELTVNVPAEVVYTQGPEARLTVIGPRGAVEQLTIEDGRLRFQHRVHRAGRLRVAMTAPDVDSFILNGTQRLRIEGFKHDRLEVRLAGSGDVEARGEAHTVELTIAGSGDVDLSGVTADEAEVTILGSGDAVVSPRNRAEVDIAGSGDVTLTTRPAMLDTDIRGSGRVVQGSAVAPTAPTTKS
jgi:hypothetical protein